MKIIELTDELIPQFSEYFRRYSHEQDVSFPPLEDYKTGKEETVYLLTDEYNNIAGAAALMLHKNYREAGAGRFRILHCVVKSPEYYMMLMNEILKHTAGLDYIYCFIEDKQEQTRGVWEEIGFKIKRYSWVLKRNVKESVPPDFPEGFTLRNFRFGADEEAFCGIINESFDGMQGHTKLYPEKIAELKKEPSYLDDGLKILWHKDKAIGTIALIKEREYDENIVFIESVGLLNEYQGRGLGKCLIRSALEYGRKNGYVRAMLSVNAENERAADMYINEGFQKEALIICYSYEISK